MKLWRIFKALSDLPDLADGHWAMLNTKRGQLTWACIIDGKPARLPVRAICARTGRWLIEYPDGGLELIDRRPVQALRVGERPEPPTSPGPSASPLPPAAEPRSAP